MIRKNLKTIEKLSEGHSLLEKFHDVEINGVSIDSRDIKKGNLFVPLIGENFDAHDFLDKAIEGGAKASLWQKDLPSPDNDFPLIMVDDTLEALQTLAKNYKESLGHIKIIAITGSNGKTATKDILEGILSTKYNTQKTMGNYNNEIGLPLTLLSLDENTEVSILEMGTDGFGQIEFLTRLTNPDIAIITNISASHLDLLKSKENVARAKLEILLGLKSKGLFIYNNDDETLLKIMKEYEIKQDKLNFGTKENSDFKIKLIKEGIDGITFRIAENKDIYTLHIPIIGRHNIYNGAASIIAARKLGLNYKEIQKGLYNIHETGMRNQILKKENFTILNDAYKSNPDSLVSALDTLYSIEGYEHKVVVLGDMVDLGDHVIELHKEIGPKIDPTKVDKIFTIGDLAKHIGDTARINFKDRDILHAETKDELVLSILKNIDKDTLILIKASRSVALEDIIDKLVNS